MLNQLVRLVKTLHQDAGIEGVALHMEYVLRALKSNEQQRAFEEALRRTVSGQGGEIMTYVHRMIDEGRREARQEGRREGIREGELRGRLQTIRGLLGSELPWSIIEAATGIDEAASRRLKQQLDDNGSGRAEWVRSVPGVRYRTCLDVPSRSRRTAPAARRPRRGRDRRARAAPCDGVPSRGAMA